MPELDFAVEDIQPEHYAATPRLAIKLQVSTPASEVLIRNVMLQCQLRIDVTRRRYSREDQARLVELFGEPERWSDTLRSLLWTNVSVVIPTFQAHCRVDLPVPCSFDFNLAATKYFYGLADGEVPLELLFSGSVLYHDPDGVLQFAQIGWDKEATYRLPVSVWQSMMDHYYPNSAWLRLPRDVFDRLYQYKRDHGYPTWERTLESLLEADAQRVAS